MKKDNSWKVEPECINHGCGNKVHTRKINKNGTRDVRSECQTCHKGNRNRPGVTPHKKTYCENVDGRLGFKCSCTIEDECQLELDHIDGDRWSEKEFQVRLKDPSDLSKTKIKNLVKNNKILDIRNIISYNIKRVLLCYGLKRAQKEQKE